MRSLLPSIRFVLPAILCGGVFLRGVATEAATLFELPGWGVGAPDSTYQEWDVFTDTPSTPSYVPNVVPDVGHFPDDPLTFAPKFSASPAVVSETSNLYWYGGDYNWWADIDNYGSGDAGEGTRLIVQTAATLNDGVGVYPDSLAVVKPDGSAIPGGDNASALREMVLFEGPINLGGNPVTTQERLWEFYLPGYFDDFRVKGSSHVHSSLMQFRVDSIIAPVPEPGAIALASTGLIALGTCRIIRRFRRRGNRSA